VALDFVFFAIDFRFAPKNKIKVQPHKGSRAAHSPTVHPHVEVADQRSRKRCPLFRLEGAQLTLPRSGTALSPVVQFPKFYKKKKRKKTITAPKDWIGSCGPDVNATVAEN
jgi:hypothetical protein